MVQLDQRVTLVILDLREQPEQRVTLAQLVQPEQRVTLAQLEIMVIMVIKEILYLISLNEMVTAVQKRNGLHH